MLHLLTRHLGELRLGLNRHHSYWFSVKPIKQENNLIGQETLVENIYLDGKRKRRRKKIWLQPINKRALSISFFKRSKPVSKKMVPSNETTETNSVKNAENAVVIVVSEEDNDVTLTTDHQVVLGN